MDKVLKKQLEDVFGGAMQVAPGGTGAVLTRPSKLSMDIADEVVRAMPMDGVFRSIGSIAAEAVANELEIRSLRAADYANLPDLPKVVAKRIVGYLLRSEEFSRSFIERLSARG